MQLAAGAVILTVNQRLAAYLAEQYDRQQRQSGRQAWASPSILPLSAWLSRCREGVWPERPLLSSNQANLLWESAIGDLGLLNRSAAAIRAGEAWDLMAEWHLDSWRQGFLGDSRAALSADVAAFLGWADDYERRLAEGGMDDASRLMTSVAGWLSSGRVESPDEVWFAGFDRQSPALETLQSALTESGCKVGIWPGFEAGASAPDTSVSALALAAPPLVVAEDIQQEADLAARWARARLISASGRQVRVAIVVPDLAAYRPVLERALAGTLVPGSVAGAGESVANFSLGGSLASVPVVAGALALLGISQRRLPVHQLIGVLKGPWLGAGEGDYRALAASRIASKRRGDMTLGGLLRELKGARQPLPATILLLEAWLRHLEGDGSSRRPSDWAQRFNDLLTILGWPGDLPQDSHAHQAASRWSALLAEFAGLDLVSGPIRRDEAVGRVAAMAARTVFQPKGDPGAVQVMGVLEAAGMGFDHLWLMGFGDHLWPPAAAPNPFLPRALQRSLGMPRADAPAELAYARQVTGRLLAAAPERVVSYPLMSDGAEVSVSPLLRHAQPITTDLDDALGLGPDVSHLHQLAVAGVLDVLQDFSGPALVDGGGAGGVSLFADQAACPFKAFASHRLGGRLDEEAGPGLDASGRGSLVHRALELLWPQLGGSEGLKNATESGDLAEKIATVVADAVSEACQGTGLSDGFARLERQRVATLVAEWLEVEGKRAPFTVTAVEQQAKARAGGVTVSTKIDRVDVLSDGSEVLIDYKTGVARFTDWFGERPDAPQLPLYLTMRATPVAALAFAIIRRGEARFSGLGAEDELLPDVKGVASAKLPEGAAEDWESVRREWQRVLHELGTAFVAGDARVDPKDDGACRYCHLDPLCRVWERDMLPQGDAS